MNVNFATQNKQQHTYHPHHLPYSPQCLKIGCRDKPYWDGKTYYSLCLKCLQEGKLGPFKEKHYKVFSEGKSQSGCRRHHEEDYSSLFWLTDWERKNTQNE